MASVRVPCIVSSGLICQDRKIRDASGVAAHDQPEADAAEITLRLAACFPRPALRRLSLYVRTALLAAIRALEGAKRYPCPADLPIVIGSAYASQKTSFDFMDSILDDGPHLASPLTFSHAVNNIAASSLSLMLKSTGTCMSINNGELSFAGALQIALDMLKTGKAEHVLVGAVDELDPRFAALFPHKHFLPAAVFFYLENTTAGTTVELHWDTTLKCQAYFKADGKERSFVSQGHKDPLFQPLACAIFCARPYATGTILQTASEYDVSAAIHLKKR